MAPQLAIDHPNLPSSVDFSHPVPICCVASWSDPPTTTIVHLECLPATRFCFHGKRNEPFDRFAYLKKSSLSVSTTWCPPPIHLPPSSVASVHLPCTSRLPHPASEIERPVQWLNSHLSKPVLVITKIYMAVVHRMMSQPVALPSDRRCRSARACTASATVKVQRPVHRHRSHQPRLPRHRDAPPQLGWPDQRPHRPRTRPHHRRRRGWSKCNVRRVAVLWSTVNDPIWARSVVRCVLIWVALRHQQLRPPTTKSQLRWRNSIRQWRRVSLERLVRFSSVERVAFCRDTATDQMWAHSKIDTFT